MPITSSKSGEYFYVLQDKIHILFVDDDPILREFARVHLTTDQATVTTAENGVAALAALSVAKPDIILLDLEMPEMDGFEFLADLARRPEFSHLPVIVITGREDIAAIDRAYTAGATSFLVKPLNWRQISYQIRYVYRTHAKESAEGDSRASVDAHLLMIAQQTLAFLRTAVEKHPDLRPLAFDFVERLDRLATDSASAREAAPAKAPWPTMAYE